MIEATGRLRARLEAQVPEDLAPDKAGRLRGEGASAQCNPGRPFDPATSGQQAPGAAGKMRRCLCTCSSAGVSQSTELVRAGCLELSDGVRVTEVQAVSIRPLLSLVGPLGGQAEAWSVIGAIGGRHEGERGGEEKRRELRSGYKEGRTGLGRNYRVFLSQTSDDIVIEK